MSTPEVPVAPPEQPAAPTAAPGGGYAGLRLPDFWSDAPAGWFLYAESRFWIRNITSEVDRFDHLVGALPKSSIRLVMDTLESPDTDRPYSALKQRLLASHELSEFQRIELLFKMEPLGSRKPSELLSHMLEICPRGEERNRFFIFLFLQRLPKELRSHLNDSEQDPVKLAAKADRKWALHSHEQHGSVNAVAEEIEDTPIAAIQPARGKGRGGRGQRSRGRGGSGRGGRGGTASTFPVPTADSPLHLAKASSGLCEYHWHYGDKARNCDQPCSWGN
jgi:hypothetical protein